MKLEELRSDEAKRGFVDQNGLAAYTQLVADWVERGCPQVNEADAETPEQMIERGAREYEAANATNEPPVKHQPESVWGDLSSRDKIEFALKHPTA